MTTQAIVRQIRRWGRGSVFTPNDFLDLGSRDAVDQALSRLSANGTIRRLDRGLYDYPKMSPRVGLRSPDPDDVAHALARRLGVRIQRSGAASANALGLSPQVPARAVYLTDGPSRTVRAGNRDLILRHVAPSRMVGAGTISGDFQNAIRFIGKTGLSAIDTDNLRRHLSDNDLQLLRRDARMFPTWIRSYTNLVTGSK